MFIVFRLRKTKREVELKELSIYIFNNEVCINKYNYYEIHIVFNRFFLKKNLSRRFQEERKPIRKKK